MAAVDGSLIRMLDRLRHSGWKPLVAALYAVAMLTLGFAHSQASMPTASGAEAASLEAVASVLPDGSSTPICGQSRSGAPGQRHGGAPCDACSLTAAPGAIPNPPALLDALRLASKLLAVRAINSVAETAALEPQSRGPPLLS